jgi:hypothetical protein
LFSSLARSVSSSTLLLLLVAIVPQPNVLRVPFAILVLKNVTPVPLERPARKDPPQQRSATCVLLDTLDPLAPPQDVLSALREHLLLKTLQSALLALPALGPQLEPVDVLHAHMLSPPVEILPIL